MPKTPRPTDNKLMKAWALKEQPNDPVRRKAIFEAGIKANDADAAAKKRNLQYEQMKQRNRLKSGGKG